MDLMVLFVVILEAVLAFLIIWMWIENSNNNKVETVKRKNRKELDYEKILNDYELTK